MVIYKLIENRNLINSIKSGDIGLLPTDTIYGLSCSAFSHDSVEKIYGVKGRAENKPVIVLISDISDLAKFDIKLNRRQKTILEENWPGKVSFILPVSKDFAYLTRGMKGLAFRMPKDGKLRAFLQKTGPLVSTSANKSDQKPAINVDEAMTYFLDNIDFYVDYGDLVSEPSTLIDLTTENPKVIRQGDYLLIS